MTNKASGIRDQFAHTFFLSVIRAFIVQMQRLSLSSWWLTVNVLEIITIKLILLITRERILN